MTGSVERVLRTFAETLPGNWRLKASLRPGDVWFEMWRGNRIIGSRYVFQNVAALRSWLKSEMPKYMRQSYVRNPRGR